MNHQLKEPKELEKSVMKVHKDIKRRAPVGATGKYKKGIIYSKDAKMKGGYKKGRLPMNYYIYATGDHRFIGWILENGREPGDSNGFIYPGAPAKPHFGPAAKAAHDDIIEAFRAVEIVKE